MNKFYLKLKEFDNRNNRNQRLNYYLAYTFLFLIILTICYFWFFFHNKSMIGDGDGIKQHCNSLIYYGNYLREIIRNLLNTGKLEIPLWDSHIGMGSDIISTLHYYTIGDPLNLLSVFVEASKTQYLYEVLIVLRLFLAGVGFSAYCKIRGKGRFATLCGALTYVFCSYALFVSTKHPFFLNPMIYLPFLLIGIEKIFAHKKPFYFIIMVFISATSNFYFFYMLSILIFLYAALRFFSIYKENRLRNLGLSLRNFCLYYVTGILLACIILLPCLLALFSTKRFSNEAVVPLLYGIDYYEKLLFGLVTGSQMGNWTIIGSSVVILPAVLLMFLQRKRHTELKIGFIVLSLFFLFPIIGHVMNGFSYECNRWSWGYTFFLAFILTTMIPELFRISKRNFFILLGAAVAYLISWYFILNKYPIMFISSWIILAISIIIFGISSAILKYKKIPTFWWKALSGLAVLVMIVVGMGLQGGGYYAKPEDMTKFIDRDTNYTKVSNQVANEIKAIEDDSFFRYELAGKAQQVNIKNSAMVNGINGLDYYLSIGDANISEFLIEMASAYYLTFAYDGLDNRSNLDTLLNVKYQVAETSKHDNPFYGYEPYKTFEMDGDSYQIYQNQIALPFGYTYSNYISRSQYEGLDSIKKQQAILQAAAIEEDNLPLNMGEIEYTDSDIPYEINCLDGMKYKDGVFIAKKDRAEVEITFKGLGNSENYLIFENLQGGDLKPVKNDNHLANTWVVVNGNNLTRSFKMFTPYYHSFDGRENYVVNLCYSEKPLTKITFIFLKKGRYSVDKLRVVNQPMDHYKTQVVKLKEDYLKDVSFSTNKITGNINLNSNKLLCLSIPYSKGWQAYVDGKEVETLKTNTMFTGIMLEEGNHSIELKYFTPGLKIALICFSIGLILLFIEILYWRNVRNRS